MNCKSARHLIFAFADGQLDVRDNCELLDHLKMCPECTTRVDEHQRVRASLRRSIEAIPVPAALAARVRATIEQPRQARNWRRLSRLVPVSLAAAACVVFAWRSVADFMSTGEVPSVRRPVTVPQGLSAAFLIGYRHNECCVKGAAHHDPDLPHDVTTLARDMSARYGDRLLVLAPDLSRAGFHLESAAFCGVQDSEARKGAHLVYAADTGDTHLSFFSVPRWDCLDRCGTREIDATGMHSYALPQADGEVLNLIYWHQDATTYVACGQIDCDKIADLFRDIRLASIAEAANRNR